MAEHIGLPPLWHYNSRLNETLQKGDFGETINVDIRGVRPLRPDVNKVSVLKYPRMPPVDLLTIRDPYNYCDRWCERCQVPENCAVFKGHEEFRQRLIAAGRDPDTWEAAFEEVAGCLKETFKLLEKGAKKWGIALPEPGSKEEKEYEAQEEEIEKRVRNHSLKKLSQDFEDHLFFLLSKFSVEEIKNDPHLQEVQWYATFVTAKIHRALASSLEDRAVPFADYDDALNSADIALRGINTTHQALSSLGSSTPGLFEDTELLLPLVEDLREELKKFIETRERLLAEAKEE